MREIDKDGLLLCKLQAETFEKSRDKTDASSGIFIRRFMNSSIAEKMDNGSILQTNLQEQDLLDAIEEEYGESRYGSVKFACEELYWIGYVYRYFSYTYELSSARVYKIIKPKEMQVLYLPYHTMDPSQAIERILEARNLLLDEENEMKRQYEIFRSIRKSCDAGQRKVVK